ncbi:MAG: hypothetical protein AVDCRST_MAG64-3115, partial [uncultured Phycisphaerae bacterium]
DRGPATNFAGPAARAARARRGAAYGARRAGRRAGQRGRRRDRRGPPAAGDLAGGAVDPPHPARRRGRPADPQAVAVVRGAGVDAVRGRGADRGDRGQAVAQAARRRRARGRAGRVFDRRPADVGGAPVDGPPLRADRPARPSPVGRVQRRRLRLRAPQGRPRPPAPQLPRAAAPPRLDRDRPAGRRLPRRRLAHDQAPRAGARDDRGDDPPGQTGERRLVHARL